MINKDKSIHQLFEELIKSVPDVIAVTYEDQHISYGALNERANQLAHYLQSIGVKLESRVGIALPRSIELIVGLLAILKSGGVYVPLDVDYPQERLGYMLEDSQIEWLLSLKKVEIPKSYRGKVIHLEEKTVYFNQPIDNLHLTVSPENLAYIIYTSGSTGRPKGVACHHASVINRLYWGWNHYSLKKNETCCLQSSIAFVDSTWDIFGTLLVGARLVLYKEAVSRNVEELLQTCLAHQITRITLIPSFLNTLIDFSPDKLRILKNTLSHWEITGESFKPNLIDHFFKHVGQTPILLDCYGATEATSVIYRDYVGKNGLKYKTKILSNTQIYLLNNDLEPVSIGDVGEIYIGGIGIARGYVNKPALTAERFIPNPFEVGSRLYKTGDLARYLPDGNIEFLGRVDHQVKLRGFRIELGEIEGTIETLEAVQQAIVLCREDIPGQKRLAAYVVPRHKADSSESDLLGSLQRLCEAHLPDYMRPSQWIVLEAFPLTGTGKIDRKGLPAPKGRTGLDAYHVPQGLLEERIAAVWSELLGIEIGRTDDFFRLGGHSLLATQMISHLRQALRLEIPIRAIFEHRVLSALARYLEQSHLEEGILPAITSVSRDMPQVLSFAQQRLWFIEQLLPNTSLYHNPIRLRLLGTLNVAALRQALNAMVARHEILRTVIVSSEGIALQKVLPENTGFALTESTEENPAFAKKTFQFECEPLCRGLLIKRSAREHVLILVFHHIVVDDWSMGIFFKELNAFYQAYAKDRPLLLPPLAVQYIDYSVWQRSWLQGEILQKQLRYWQTQLSGVVKLELPTDYPRPQELSYQGGCVQRKLSKAVFDQLQAFSQEYGVTLFMSLVASIQGFLSRYCNQTDIAIGTPIANRNVRETEGLIGFFINTLVLREQFEDNPSFETLIKRVENSTLSAYEHQDVPFEQLVEYLQVARELNRNPLFQVMFTLHPEMGEIALSELEIFSEGTEEQLSRFDLLINASVSPEGLYFGFDYAKDLFSQDRMERFADSYEIFLRGLLQEPSKRLSEISLLGVQERQQLSLWNETQHFYPKDKSIHQLFEEQVKRTPLNIAVVYEDQTLTYQALNEKANQLAHFLREQGVGPDTFVALALERSMDMVVGIFGILKAGGAYVPMDPSYPEERLIFLLEDTGVPFLITQGSLKAVFAGYNKTLYLDESWSEIEKRSKATPQSLTLPQHLAYVIYTSGSTGKPKGVMIAHQNLTHYITYAERAYPLRQGMSLVHGSYAFDMSVTALFLPLIQGYSIAIVSKSMDVEGLGEFIKAQDNLNLIKLTPTHLRALREQFSEAEIQKQKGVLIVGGENLLEEDIAYWKKASPDSDIVNEYGPTEATVGCCVYSIEKQSQIIPIGRPIANMKIYILGESLQMIPVGAIGEMYIGGAGLARGYLNRAGLTAEKFVPNPFICEEDMAMGEGLRLYRTGDLARYLPDGNIEFLGRMDDQVKVRGYRIELGEVETALSRHEDVSQGVVIAREDESGIKKLVAYVVPGDFTPSPTELREYLEKVLPDYMLPSFFVYVEQIPFTLNGKVDRKALLALDAFPRQLTDAYIAPSNEREKALCEIWSAVLGIERIGIRDHFFRIGGDSIVSIQLVSKARQKGIRFSIKDVFNYPTVEALAGVSQAIEESIPLQSQPGIGVGEALLPLTKHSDFNLTLLTQKILDHNFGKNAVLEDIYPLSALQTGLLFQALYEPNSDVYFIQSVLKIEGVIDQQALQRAWQKVCDHHAILRTGFVWEGLDKPLQYVLAKVEVSFEVEDWRQLTQVEQEARLAVCIEHDRQQGFELCQAPLFRIKLLECSAQQSYMIWSSHHILLDGWSTPLILADVLKAYEGSVTDTAVTLQHRVPYKNYISWLETQNTETAREYWQEMFSGVDGPTRLSFKRVITEVPNQKNYEAYEVELSIEETKATQRFASQHQITLNTVLQGAVGLLLQHYTQKAEVVMGVTLSGRTAELEGIEGMVGLFINTLPLKITCQNADTVEQYLKRLQEQTLHLNEHAHTPLSQIYGWTAHHEGLFDVLFVFENYPIEEGVRAGSQSFQIASIKGIEKTEYPLTIVVVLGKKIHFIFQYQTEHFNQVLIKRIATHLKNLLKNMQTHADAPRTLAYLSQEEYQQLVKTWNATEHLYSEDKTIPQLFEEQVKATPHNIALTYENEELSYQALNERANQLAHFLREQGIGPDKFVAIAVERSFEMLVGLLGILKAGGAYVPIDPSYPEERLIFMLEDTGASFLITQASLKKIFLGYEKILVIDENWQAVQKKSQENPQSFTLPQHLAYVIYTSGSTGKPKGVMCTHQGLSNRLLWMKDKYNLSAQDRILQKTPFTFDVSVWEIFLPLLAGATEVIANPEFHKEPNLILDLIDKKKVSICHFVPPMLASFLAIREKFEENSLRLVVASGDILSQETVKEFYSKINAQFDNLYGPTEASIDVTAYECQQDDRFSPSIGRPIWNTQMYILDRQLNPVPIGVSGDIYIGGMGLARGYLHRPQLTAEKFIPNPFISHAEAVDARNLRLYCTGDLALYLPDGNIEFLGRRDDQVKLRGYRIELGEIGSAIANHPDVAQVEVIAREDEPGRKRLVAYVVPKNKNGTPFSNDALIADLRQSLHSALPEYMVPSFFMIMEQIPLTVNGKVDRKALPSPDPSLRSLGDEYVAPCNERERVLCEIWSAVLGIERVGIRDHFFRMGGDSIVSIQLVSKARQKGIKFSVKDVFTHPTVEALASVSEDAKASENLQALLGVVEGEVPLSPIQKWFFEQNPATVHHFNQVMWLKSDESIDLPRLQEALKVVYHYHDGFRLRYRKGAEGWVQYYAEGSPLPWKIWQSGTEKSLGDVCTELQSSLNIEQGPLSQLLWVAETGQLLWVIHHLIVDGVSWRILLEDLNLAYAGEALGSKSHSYRDWSQSLSRYVVKSDLEYYQAQLQDIPRLPTDYVYTGYIALRDVQGLNIAFSSQMTKQFLQKAHQSYGTQPDDLLLLALVLAVGDCFGQYQICVDLEGHGREELGEHLDLTRTLGWFTSLHPVILKLPEPSNMDQSIKHVKEHLRHIPQKGVSYGILSQIQKTCAFVQGDMVFNYLGQWSNSQRQDETFFFGEGDTGLSVSLDNPHVYPLAINGGVNQGQLEFHWTYSTRHYKAETIAKLSNAFKVRLEALIEYCSEEKYYGYSPSDFPYAKLSGKQLDKLFKRLEEQNE